MLIPDAKAAVDKESKEVIQRQTTIRKVHLVALMDIRHIQKYEYIPVNVSKNNLKCGHKYEYIPWNVRKSKLKCGNYFVLHEFVHM